MFVSECCDRYWTTHCLNMRRVFYNRNKNSSWCGNYIL